jgi:propionyl-CoA synthetase
VAHIYCGSVLTSGRVVDDEGSEIKRGKMGNIVLALPLAPTAFRTLWEDEERFYKGYLKRFSGKWIDTGDAGWIDEKGYIHIMARTGKPPPLPHPPS